MLDYLVTAFTGPGAAFMYAITALGALSLTIVIERMVLLLKWSSAGEGSPQAEVLAAGRAQTDADAAWDAMGGSAAAQEERIRRRIGALGAVANIATMLGLLGTVYGLILAFSALGDAGAGEKAVRLSEGISTAMATTAWGLVVGIPSLGFHALLDGMARSRVAAIEAAAGALAAELRASVD